MNRLIPIVLGFVLVALTADSAFAQRGRNAGVNTPYGHFSASEMSQAGGDPMMAQQLREQKQMMQYEQQMLKQQQQSMQQMAKRQEFLKKHPEAAKALAAPTRVAKKSASKKSKSTADAPTPKTDQSVATEPSASTSTLKAKRTN